MYTSLLKEISLLLKEFQYTTPLVHHITNYVSVNDSANVTLAIGASPVMADDLQEVKEITSMSSSLVLNIGTLNERTVTSMIEAGKKANELKIPVIFDPVGAGASDFRNKTVNTILNEVQCSVLRGNLSEILYIAGFSNNTKGVDTSEKDLENEVESRIDTAKLLANKYGCVVAVTGSTDIISNGNRTVCIENCNRMLSKVTGTGCMCTSLIGSFCGVTDDYFLASISGILIMGIAGELGFERSGGKGMGSYRISIIDEISKINSKTIHRLAKVYEA